MDEQRSIMWTRVTDALLVTALFAPYAPLVATLYSHFLPGLLGCDAAAGRACALAGFDIHALHARSAELLERAAHASASGYLLLYIALLAGLVQLTVTGFRGRIVRTCAAIMCAGVLPLVLGLASAMTRAPERFCGIRACEAGDLLNRLSFYGTVLFDWLADIAVPLGVLVSGLLALTLGYRALVGWVVSLMPARD